jgi:Domain of unknown function (DUF4208)
METRVLALLKKIERARNPDAVRVRPGRKSRKAGGKDAGAVEGKSGRAPKRRAETYHNADAELHEVCCCCCWSHQWYDHFTTRRIMLRCPLPCFACSRGQSLWRPRPVTALLAVQATCQSALAAVLPEMRKMRLISRSDGTLPPQRAADKTRKYILAIGDAITSPSAAGSQGVPSAAELWDYVSAFSENDCPGSTIAELYASLARKRDANGGAPAAPRVGGADDGADEAGPSGGPGHEGAATEDVSPEDSPARAQPGAEEDGEEQAALLAFAGGKGGGAVAAGAGADEEEEDEDDDDAEEDGDDDGDGDEAGVEEEGEEDDDWQA